MKPTNEILMYGAPWCKDCKRAKQFFAEHAIDYTWIDITDNAEAIALVEKVNKGNRSIPTIFFPDGEILVEPSNAELEMKLDVRVADHSDIYDVVVIGGGPAGLTAAIYTSREGLNTLVIDESGLGGQTAITQVLENFPGFEEGVSGMEFADKMAAQAKRFGTKFVQGEEIVDITREDEYLVVKSINKKDYLARSVLIATGTRYKRTYVPGEMELIGMNVHFCATCDGAFYQDKEVLVIGGGNSGFEEGLHLAHFASSVTIVEFLPEVKASKILQDKVAANPKMKVITNHAVKELLVNDDPLSLAGVVIENRATGVEETWTTDGIFVFIGLIPNSNFLPESIERDEWNFVLASPTLETSMPGVFVAGDVRQGSTKQAVSAAGEGATAAMMMRQYIENLPIPTTVSHRVMETS